MAAEESHGQDRFVQLEKSLSTLIENVSNSLHREIQDVNNSLHREIQDGFRTMNERFDRSESRLERHGGMLAAGSRWTTRMGQWSERVDKTLADQSREIGELRDRLRKLEEGPA
jgi:chromosome segregation ATPase